jgi:hypothetical protein
LNIAKAEEVEEKVAVVEETEDEDEEGGGCLDDVPHNVQSEFQ